VSDATIPGGAFVPIETASSAVAPGFADLFATEADRLVRLAYLLTDSNPVAEEIVQESFIGLYRQWDTVREPLGYVRTSVVNRARNHRRNQARADKGMVRLVDRGQHDLNIPDPGGALLNALSALPERQRVAVVLRYWGDWSESEIARSLDCRPGTVKSLVSRALDELRKVVSA
jgi:DNA-directed RNA polymerase specialized sigma24 family protein